MVRKLLSLVALLSLSLTLSAQTIPAEKIILHIKENSASVKFAFRINDSNGSLVCDFGEGEGIQTFPADAAGNVTTVEYTFNTVSESPRTITLAADKLLTLRFANNKSINGIAEATSSMLQNLNADYTDFSAHSVVDVTGCPNLEALTLTYTDVTEVKLPASKMLQSLQISPALLPKGHISKIDLSKLPNLRDLLLSNSNIDTLDVRNNPNLESLVVNSSKGPLRAILGAKDLKKLTRLDVRGNSLGFEHIPDRITGDAAVEDFRYGSQGSYLLNASRVKGFMVDLSDVAYAQGIATSKQETKFTWFYRTTKGAAWTEVPATKMTQLRGVFVFGPSLAVNDTISLYFRMANDGFPAVGVKNKNYISSYILYLVDKTLGIAHDVAPDFSVIPTATGCRIVSAQAVSVQIYSLDGKQIWKGMSPSDVPLERGTYIVRAGNGKVVKFVK